MNLYENYCLPCLLNLACGTRAIGRIRAEVVPQATGRVLEVGMGGGLNLSFYDGGKVESICGIEPSEGMRKKADKLVRGMEIPVEMIGVPAEEIPLEDGSVDTVLLTFTLCSIADWSAALHQMRRVLKPDGRLIFCEHGLAPDEGLRRWQERINPYWRRLAGGCNLDRPIPRMLEESGFRLQGVQADYLRGLPWFASYLYRGTACKR